MSGLFMIKLYRFDDIVRTQADTFANMPERESKLFVLFSWDQKMRTSKVKLDYSLYDEERGTIDFQV